MAADEIKKCSVRIGGVYYQLVTAENEQYTRRIAARADEMINRFLQDNPQLSQTMATVLALVNAVDELARAYQQLKGMEGQHLDLDSKASEARRELSRLREQQWEMKKELLRITDLNRDYQTLINKLTQAEAQKEPAKPTVEETLSPKKQTTSSDKEQSAPSDEEQSVSSDKEQSASLDDNQSLPDDMQYAVNPESDRTVETQDLADQEANQPVPTADQPDPSSEMDEEEEMEAEEETEAEETEAEEEEEEQTPEQIPIVEPPTDLPDPSRRTIDRLQQTNLDDYLHAFGLNEKSRDTAQSDR